jgi:excisionase family DNA binding protein
MKSSIKSSNFLLRRASFMRTDLPNAGRPAYYTVREAAWILGVNPSTVSRAIRLGTLRAVRRHGRLVVPASALTQLFGDGRGESR